MIIFQLNCQSGHEFEGWFSDQHDYQKQQEKGLLTCPFCHTRKVHKVLSSVALIQSHSTPAHSTPVPTGTSASTSTPVTSTKTKQVSLDPVMLVKAIDQYVKKNFENV